MIQLKRGSTSSWKGQTKPLADGQPGYDRERHKLKIGDGKSAWEKLPDASGLRMEEILESEDTARSKAASKAAFNPLGTLIAKALKLEDRPVFTYGKADPDEETIGQVYLQQYESEPELDYIVDKGVSRGWYYQKWHSGFAKCSGTFEISTGIQSAFEQASLYQGNSALQAKNYPFTFLETPTEVASLMSPGNIVWLAGKTVNTTAATGTYVLISPDSKQTATYKIHFEVSGFWR